MGAAAVIVSIRRLAEAQQRVSSGRDQQVHDGTPFIRRAGAEAFHIPRIVGRNVPAVHRHVDLRPYCTPWLEAIVIRARSACSPANQPTTPSRLIKEHAMTAVDQLADTDQSTTTPAVAARAVDVSKTYGSGDTQIAALDRVSVELPRGQLTAIMGPSGSGKSTLLHCLAGLDRLSSGEVWIGDTNLAGLHDRALTILRRDRVGFVFQAYNLVPTLTARENILLPLRLGHHEVDEGWFDRIITALDIGDRLDHLPSELSGGQQQRVAAARAIVGRPELVFADEPTGNLDSRSATELLELIRRTVDEFGQTVVMVTHDPRAASYADRVLFLADGRIVTDMADPTLDRILDRLKTLGA